MTWNENVFYAGADGHIGFWHPGLYPRRSSPWDVRFPPPGTGEHDHLGVLPFEQMPHAVDPQVGYLANWNGKPAEGWVNDLMSPANSHVAGRAYRLQVIHELLAADASVTPEDLRAMEYRLGVVDQRWPEFGPLLRALRAATGAAPRGAPGPPPIGGDRRCRPRGHRGRRPRRLRCGLASDVDMHEGRR